MHNRALHDTLATFTEEAAGYLLAQLADGAEIPFELVEEGRASSPLYCYRPQTERFIVQRLGELVRMPTYPAAAQGMEALPGLDGYLRAHGVHVATADRRAHADAALRALLVAMWGQSSELSWEPVRFEAVFADLEQHVYDGYALLQVLAPVDGLVLESDEVQLGEGISLMRAGALPDAPPELRGDPLATVALVRLDDGDADGALVLAGGRLRRLQTALRLWDDAEPAVGPAAFARTPDGPWSIVPLAGGLRRMREDCLLAMEEEDPLRAFCGLVSRRTPRGGELAWALRRFELGCERPSATEGITDWIMAARALLADPADHGTGAIAARLAAICAPPAEYEALTVRLTQAMAMERSVVAGTVRAEPAIEVLVSEFGACVRAVLRDVLCGHLDKDLRTLADGLLARQEESAAA